MKKSWRPWLYLLPSLVFLILFMVYPLFDVIVYSLEEGYNSASQTYWGWDFTISRMCCVTPIFCRRCATPFLLSL